MDMPKSILAYRPDDARLNYPFDYSLPAVDRYIKYGFLGRCAIKKSMPAVRDRPPARG